LSRSIARLEEELGQPLFERQPRSVSLTDAGKLLLDRARRILALADDAKAEITDDGESGTIRIGVIPTIAPYYLPSTLREFEHCHPRAHLVVQEDTTDRLLKNLADGSIDVAICASPVTDKTLQVTPMFEEPLWLVLSSNHPLNKKRAIRECDLENVPFVLLGEAHCLSDSILSYCRQKSFQPVIVERTSQLATVQELVALNHGISFVPDMAKRLDSSTRRVYRRLVGDGLKRTIVMATNPYRYSSRLERRFCDLLCSASPLRTS
jgi:LysR family hydrogen peroxide-inducible transcriptional activator